MDLISAELPAKTLVVAIDPGKAANRVLLADGERGLIGEPVSLPTLREGVERVCELIDAQAAPDTVIAIEATGSLITRAPGRLSRATAEFWSERWRGCLSPPPDAELRADSSREN